MKWKLITDPLYKWTGNGKKNSTYIKSIMCVCNSNMCLDNRFKCACTEKKINFHLHKIKYFSSYIK